MAERQERTVLLIDRDESGITHSRAILCPRGYRVLAVGGGAEAIDAARVETVHLIMISPPAGENGVCAIHDLRCHPATGELPILVCGSELSHHQIEAALDCGADEYLDRPFGRKELLLRVSFATGVRTNQRSARSLRANLIRRMGAMEALHRFYEEIIAHDAVETTCQRSAEMAAEITDSQRVSVLLTDAERQSLQFAHAIGIDRYAWRRSRVPLSSPVAGRVLATGREIVVNRGTLWPSRGWYNHPQFVSMPLVCTNGPDCGSVLGVLNVTERRVPGDYTPQDVLALRQLARAASFAIDTVRTRRKLDATRDSIIFSLARLSEYRHASTGKHLERVRELSLVLARRLMETGQDDGEIDGQFLTDLGRAAPLHDVGKVAIPDSILLKQAGLTDAEFATIQDHTRIGAATLQSVMAAGHDASFLKMAMDIAHCHHERYDGTGYPRALCGKQIPLSARIVCLTDSYDAIRMAREYKPARSHRDAVRELVNGSGTQFDPAIVRAFYVLRDQFERIYSNLFEDHPPRRGESRLPHQPEPVA